MRSTLLLFASIGSLAVIGCVDPNPDPDVAAQLAPTDNPGDPPTDPTGGGGPAVCKTVTISGRVLYNDLRRSGRFADRSSLLPIIPGGKDAWSSSTDRQNYLGMKGAKISIYEIDGTASAGAGCVLADGKGATYAASDGTWSWTGNVCDLCRADGEGPNDNGVSVAAKISLSYCPSPDTSCFSVDDPGPNGVTDHYGDAWSGTTWSRWTAGASSSSSRLVLTTAPIAVGTDYFQSTSPALPMVATDLEAQAANVFASMIDVTERVHVVEGIDFDHARWGTIRAYFPSTEGGVAHSHQASRLCVAAPQTRDNANSALYQNRNPDTWLNGDEVAHEYGHLTHFWQWGGVGKWQSFCYDSNGSGVVSDAECGESSATREFAGTAFKEAWAAFIARVTFDGAGTGWSCGSLDGRTPIAIGFRLIDNSLVCPAGAATCTQGRHFIDDVEHALCEIWDDDEDDALAVPLTDMVETLGYMWDAASDDERDDIERADTFGPGDTAEAPLGLCRYAGHLDVHRGLPRTDVEGALAVAKIDCEL